LMSIAIRTSQLATNVMDSLLSAKVSDVALYKTRESATGAADGASISSRFPQPKEAMNLIGTIVLGPQASSPARVQRNQ